MARPGSTVAKWATNTSDQAMNQTTQLLKLQHSVITSDTL